MNGVQTRLKCKPNVKQCKRLVFPARSALFNHNILNTKAISHFQANHILIRFVFPPLEGVAIPGSLANIFKEIHRDLGKPIPTSGNLDRWVAQGVFSMNSVLTVRAHETGSHRNVGWETFTDAVIKKLSDEREHLVFMLWGVYAKEKAALIDSSKHLILTTVHPSPRSAEYGFFGCRHFSKANDYLRSKGIEEIDW